MKSMAHWLYESYSRGYGEEKHKIELSNTRARTEPVEKKADDAPWAAKDSALLVNQYLRALEGIAAGLGRSKSSVQTELRRLGY